MTSATDPHRRFQRQVTIQAGACWLLALAAGVWAWRAQSVAASPAPPSSRPAPTAVPATTAPVIDAAAWRVNLWQPFTGEAPTAAVAAAPSSFKLYSIMQQDGGLTAAIAAGDSPGMLYVKAGDSGNGFTVVCVEATSVILRINGQEQRLGLGP